MGQAVPYTSDQLAPAFQKQLYKEGCKRIFLSPDPFPGYLAIPQSLNQYPYTWNNSINYVDPDGMFAIGAIIGGGIGAVSGASGAIAQGGDVIDVAVSAIIGGVAGAAMGLVDPTEGVATTMVIAGAVGGATNAAGQIITQAINGVDPDCIKINGGAVIGSVIGSAVGGGMGNVATNMAINIGATPAISTAVSAIGMGPSALGGGIGGRL